MGSPLNPTLTATPCGQMEKELMTMDKSGTWPTFFKKMVESSNGACQMAGLTARVGNFPLHVQLNRYRDVLPWDQTRVKLTGNGAMDYINASHVTPEAVGIKELKRQYILTQAPLDNTVHHFWQMIWEQNVAIIVMLNNVIEQKKVKSAQYWPLGAENKDSDGYVLEGAGLELLLIGVEETPHFRLSRLLLRAAKGGAAAREIQHFHYTSWPDFGVPSMVDQDGSGFNDFVRRVRRAADIAAANTTTNATRNTAANTTVNAAGNGQSTSSLLELSPSSFSSSGPPMVIHCSAGIGRTGTFLLIDIALSLIQAGKSFQAVPDLSRLLVRLRGCRMGLVQTFEQMRLCYSSIVDEGKRLLSTNEAPPKNAEGTTEAAPRGRVKVVSVVQTPAAANISASGNLAGGGGGAAATMGPHDEVEGNAGRERAGVRRPAGGHASTAQSRAGTTLTSVSSAAALSGNSKETASSRMHNILLAQRQYLLPADKK